MAENARASSTCNPKAIDMLEVTGSNPGPGKINLIKIEKNTNGIPDSIKVHLSVKKKGRLI
jgi:hypothetical protein